MDIKIVPCEEKYIESAIELTYTAWQPIFDNYRKSLGEKIFNALYSDWKDVKYNRVYNGLTSGRGYIALLRDEVVGFIFYEVDNEKKIGYVEENAVNSNCRGLGIAKKMYNFVFDKMRNEGMIYTMVMTGLDDAHAPARRAYEKVGFDHCIENIRYYKEL